METLCPDFSNIDVATNCDRLDRDDDLKLSINEQNDSSRDIPSDTDALQSVEDFSSSSNADRVVASRTDPNALPGRIANALVIVYEGLQEVNLVENHRRVLSCLIRFGVDLNDPNRDIFIKKSTIANKIGVNEATVYRSLAALEKAGLITRSEQKRTSRSWKTITDIQLPEATLRRLGLLRVSERPAEPDHKLSKTIGNKVPVVSNSIAAVQDVNHEPKQSSLKNHPQSGPFEKIGERTVPSDLAWLHNDNGLKLSGLFKLMKTAKAHGARLSDVVKHSLNTLKTLRGRELYAYISTLISLPIDFGFVASWSEQKAARAESETAAKAEFARKIGLLDKVLGQTFQSPNGDLWTVEERGFAVTMTGNGRTGSVPFLFAKDAVDALLSSQWPLAGGGARSMPSPAPAKSPEGRTISLTRAATEALSGLKTHLRSRGCRVSALVKT